jgi:hypothetical protein
MSFVVKYGSISLRQLAVEESNRFYFLKMNITCWEIAQYENKKGKVLYRNFLSGLSGRILNPFLTELKRLVSF